MGLHTLQDAMVFLLHPSYTHPFYWLCRLSAWLENKGRMVRLEQLYSAHWKVRNRTKSLQIYGVLFLNVLSF